MVQEPADSRDPRDAVDELARLALSGERRLQRLERLFRWTALLFVLTLALVLYALVQVLGAGPAQAQRGWPHVAPEPVFQTPLPQPGPAAIPAPEESRPPLTGFRTRIEELRAEIARAEDHAFDPVHALAVLLHDIGDVLRDTRAMLEVMPQIGADMGQMRGDMNRIAATMGSMDQKMTGVPLMAEEMRRLNTNIDIMTTSIDSTMGRMGRMMPYFW